MEAQILKQILYLLNKLKAYSKFVLQKSLS